MTTESNTETENLYDPDVTDDPQDPDDNNDAQTQLYSISAGGFSASADAIAYDDETNDLWFVSLLGPQQGIRAIWASMLKTNPDNAHIKPPGEDSDFIRLTIPNLSLGTWTAKMTRLQATGGFHALVYTKLAEYSNDRLDFLLVSRNLQEDMPALHYRFLDRRTQLPIHRTWAQWLWDRGIENGEIKPLTSTGITAYYCGTNEDQLRLDLSQAVREGQLTTAPAVAD